MSILRFRVWNPQLQSMHDMESGNIIFVPKGCIVMQHTGKSDQEGKPIFEDDILSYGDPQGYRVFWDHQNACWGVKRDQLPRYTFSEMALMTTVIGNVHQNPGLIKY